MKNKIYCWKQIKRTLEGRFTFMRQIYYACITKKKLQPKILILSFDFQNLHFYNKEKFSQKKKIISVFNENTD